METVHKFEKTLADWYKNVPHLPKGGQTWLANNVWWLVIIGVVLSAFGLFGILTVLLFAGASLTLAGGVVGGGYGSAVGATVGGLVLIVTLISLAAYIIELVLMIMAISPLNTHKKKGWDLLFLVLLVNTASAVVIGLVGMNIGSIFFGLLWSALGAYFLFEIRGHFETHKPAAKKTADKKESKA